MNINDIGFKPGFNHWFEKRPRYGVRVSRESELAGGGGGGEGRKKETGDGALGSGGMRTTVIPVYVDYLCRSSYDVTSILA